MSCGSYGLFQRKFSFPYTNLAVLCLNAELTPSVKSLGVQPCLGGDLIATVINHSCSKD